MAQPLSQFRRKAAISVNTGTIANAPQFAALVMRVIAHWAAIDGDMAMILARLLRADIEAGAAMYQALNGGEAKKAVLLAAAKASVPEYQFILIQAVLKAIKPSRDQRNDFAHNVWGKIDGCDDALLLMPPSVVVERNLAYSPGEADGEFSPNEFDRTKIMVYRTKDFVQAVREATEAEGLVGLLYGAIGHQPTEQARRLLLNEPLVQQALQPLIRESSPVVQAQLRPPGDDPPAPGISEMWDRSLGRID